MKAYEILITEDKKVYIEAEDIYYGDDTKNGVRMAYLTVTVGELCRTVATFNLANIIGIREFELATNKEDK